MSRRACLAAALALVAGCRGDSPERDENATSPIAERPSDPPPGAWVLLEPSATRYLGPSASGPSVVRASARAPSVVRVLGSRAGFIEVETIDDVLRRGCAHAIGVEDKYRLRFFVTPDALAPVLARPKHVDFGDGTSIDLRAGVPVSDDALRIGAAELKLELEADDIGSWYPEPSPSAEAEAEQTLTLSPGATLYYGEASLSASRPHLGQAQSRESIPAGERLIFVNACGTLRLRAEPDAVVEDPPQDDLLFADPDEPRIMREHGRVLGYTADYDPFADDGVCERERWSIAEGTPLRWADGEDEAGVVVDDHLLPPSTSAVDGRVCFSVEAFELCADANALERVDDPLCAELGLVGSRGAAPRQLEARLLHHKPELRAENLHPVLLRRLMQAHDDELMDCYESGLARAPELAGRLTLSFTVGRNGRVVGKASTTGTLEPADAATEACFAKVVSRIRFGKIDEQARVTYTIELLPPAAKKSGRATQPSD